MEEQNPVSIWVTIRDLITRIIAVFIASGLTVLGAGAVAGVDIASAVLMAGILGVASVLQKLARDFLDDGKLSPDEIDAAFAKLHKDEE